MNKHEIVYLLTGNHNSFISYMNKLSDEDFLFSNNGKWTAGQQLGHMVLCVKPLVRVFSMDKPTLEKTFGRSNRASYSYEALSSEYTERLKAGGKAPSRFLPEPVTIGQRYVLTNALTTGIKEICTKLDNFTEQDLDDLFIQHPLLGDITLREMLYNMIDHVAHHKDQAKQNLKKK